MDDDGLAKTSSCGYQQCDGPNLGWAFCQICKQYGLQMSTDANAMLWYTVPIVCMKSPHQEKSSSNHPCCSRSYLHELDKEIWATKSNPIYSVNSIYCGLSCTMALPMTAFMFVRNLIHSPVVELHVTDEQKSAWLFCPASDLVHAWSALIKKEAIDLQNQKFWSILNFWNKVLSLPYTQLASNLSCYQVH
jgi:hypothetical protein